MKLLLTSCGLSNQTIAKALFEMVGKPPAEIKLAFIPTAANVETGDKDWLINDLINTRKQGFAEVSIVDISAVPEAVWRPQLDDADVLFFGGGNTYHLMRWVRDSGLAKLIPEYLKTKVYVGLSAGSMILGKDIDIRLNKDLYGEETEAEAMPGLGLVDFHYLPHLDSPHFEVRRKGKLDTFMHNVRVKTYALDDQSALKVIDGAVEYVGEGEYLEYN